MFEQDVWLEHNWEQVKSMQNMLKRPDVKGLFSGYFYDARIHVPNYEEECRL